MSRLLSDNGSCYISHELAEYIGEKNIKDGLVEIKIRKTREKFMVNKSELLTKLKELS